MFSHLYYRIFGRDLHKVQMACRVIEFTLVCYYLVGIVFNFLILCLAEVVLRFLRFIFTGE